jgi:serine/threonine-protein kinase
MSDQDSRLTLTREIARSGIATVWEGYDTGLGRKVLVKSIHPQYAQESDLRARFEREAQAIARLSHDNVVRIYDLRSDATELSLILEYVEGANLGKLLKERGALPVEVATTIAVDILNGLEQAHAAGIIHRDLKPDNVLVSDRGEVKITDFGLATLKDLPTVTQEGMVVGTPAYMAPEQAEGGEITAATDIFALGLILFEMLTGQRIHQGTSMAETFQNVLKYQPPHFEEFSEVIPEAMAPVLRRMLEKAPGKRFQNAADARDALLEGLPEGTLPKTLVADFLSGETIRRMTPTAAGRTRRGSKILQQVTILLLVVAGVVLIYQFASLTHAPRPVPQGPQPWNPDSSAKTQTGDSTGIKTDTAGTKPVTDQKSSTVGDSSKSKRPVTIIPPPPAKVDTSGNVDPGIPGMLDISCRPWANVYFQDSLLGTTPFPGPLTLPSGPCDLVLLNKDIGLPIVRHLLITPGRTTELKIDLYDYVSRIRIASVKPWAEVYVDGKFEFSTPSSRVIFRPLGKHIITLKHPEYPPYSDTLTFREGDPVREIRVDLTHPPANTDAPH